MININSCTFYICCLHWDKVIADIRSLNSRDTHVSLPVFCHQLKTFLFNESFPAYWQSCLGYKLHCKLHHLHCLYLSRPFIQQRHCNHVNSLLTCQHNTVIPAFHRGYMWIVSLWSLTFYCALELYSSQADVHNVTRVNVPTSYYLT